MNKTQKKAIKSLERAFKKCADAKLSFYGVDCDLIVVTHDGKGITDIPSLLASDRYIHINTHGSYVDSGGA